VQFRSPGEGVAEFPLTLGETLGIHVIGRHSAFETIVVAAHDGTLIKPFDPRSDLFTGSSKSHGAIRIPLTNPDSEERTYVLQMNYQWIDLATLYTPDGAGGFRVQEQGKVQHYSAAKSAPLGPAFAFTLGPHESQVLFLKLQESHWLQPSFTLWKNLDAFQQRVLDVNRFVHTYLGLMAGLFLANLCALIAFRYRDLIYYLLFLVATSALHCSNFNLFTVYRPDWIRPNSILM